MMKRKAPEIKKKSGNFKLKLLVGLVPFIVSPEYVKSAENLKILKEKYKAVAGAKVTGTKHHMLLQNSEEQLRINRVKASSFFSSEFLNSFESDTGRFFHFKGVKASVMWSFDPVSDVFAPVFMEFRIKAYGENPLFINLNESSQKYGENSVISISDETKSKLYAKVIDLVEKGIINKEVFEESLKVKYNKAVLLQEMKAAKNSIDSVIGQQVKSIALKNLRKTTFSKTPSKTQTENVYYQYLIRELERRDLISESKDKSWGQIWLKWAKKTVGELTDDKQIKLENQMRQKGFENRQGAQYSSYQKRRAA